MSNPPLPRQILRLRDSVWRRRRDLRLRTQADARRFVKQVGFCLFWPTHGVEMPNLLQAIAGNARPLSSGYDDPAIGKSWNWKDESLDKRWWYYGKLLRKRATLVSLDLLPAFYALSENFGDPQDYLIEYREGRLSAEAKALYEALLENGPLDVIRLRQESRLTAPQAKARFERALAELQADLKVLPSGVAEAGAWRYAFVYDLVERWFPDLSERAQSITTRVARERILTCHVKHMVAVDRRHAASSLGWRPADVERVLPSLLGARALVEVPTGDDRLPNLLTTRGWAKDVRAAVSAGRPSMRPAPRRRTDAARRRRGMSQ
jgi:hypothetical protein